MTLKLEAKVVFEQWKYLYENKNKYGQVLLINYPSIDDDKKKIGHNHKMNINEYESSFHELSNSNKCSVVFNDGGIICFNYLFDDEGMIVEHHLNFFPCPYNDEENIEVIMSKLVRIDFEEVGYKASEHSKVHFHSGKYSTLRMPFINWVSPLEFFSFILVHFYKSKSSDILEKICHESRKTMCDEENGTFALSFVK